MDEQLDVWMVFHVIAATEEAATASLDEHVEQLEAEPAVVSMATEMDEVSEVEQPHPQLEKGYSRVCEADMSVKSFASLVELVINYGPTSVEVTSPDEVTMDIGELRNALNAVAQMMHQFLQSGAGGMMISSPQ